jgi:cytosine/adenosine deaminase-related metal-dependent hydrolase
MARQSVYKLELMDRTEDLALQGLNSAKIRAILSNEFRESNAPNIKAVERHMKSLKARLVRARRQRRGSN